MTKRQIIICRDVEDLRERTAQQFVRLARHAIEASGRFTVALSGGTTPRTLYARLAAPDVAQQIDWSRIHLFWGDERCVDPDHSDSNYRMVRESLLAHISIPPENVHRMAGEKNPQTAVAEYEAELRRVIQLTGGALPRFDLIFLGLGEDGHTASLFPSSDALNDAEHLVAPVYVERLKGHRLTLTLPVLNEGAEVVFLIAGSSKAEIVKKLLSEHTNVASYPAARVQPRNGNLTWMITADAAPATLSSKFNV
jgi:6-phosphogluconolactonase